ncbi:hypothetical protein WICMUC_001651 [Wickerhamomyces mucosus]|uniref:Metal homeostatis protein BSD2 n=1 Tax=Wickerhamomyces mucosus TaxID=1378264 RepID=A0A9P8PV85_9ASCO|nr:hypothetical protein WICMUC_001651 [Wickerhamomyces mucosus]
MPSYQQISQINPDDFDLEAQNFQNSLLKSSNGDKILNDDDIELDDFENNNHEIDGRLQNNDIGSSSSQINDNSFNNQRIRNLVNIQSVSSNFNFLDKLYSRRPTEEQIRRLRNGSGNDGVFSNLSAKPDLQPNHDSDKPPTYEEASQDSSPPYWENTMFAPGFGEEIFVDGLPVGNIINFIWNLLVCSSFQFVGFLLTYILHTSHAAKQGSRAGLGITFMTYGYYMIKKIIKPSNGTDSLQAIHDMRIQPISANDYDIKSDTDTTTTITTTTMTNEFSIDSFTSLLSSGGDTNIDSEKTGVSWKISIFGGIILGLGFYLFIKAFIDYHRAKKMEQTILQPPAPASTPSGTVDEEEVEEV